MIKDDKIRFVCEEIKSNFLKQNDILDIIRSSKLFDDLNDDLHNERYFVFDGRLEDAIIKVIKTEVIENESSFESYEHFLSLIVSELSNLAMPTLILLPLVFLNGVIDEQYIVLKNSNYALFPFAIKSENLRNQRSALREHVLKTICAKLPENHILRVKDAQFFNYPILALKIHNIDSRVEREAPKINEAIYSFIRMIGFNNERDRGWILLGNTQNIPSTYTVYYNETGSLPFLPNDSCSGYSFRFMFAPLLDISYQELKAKMDLLSDNMDVFIKIIFRSKKDNNEKVYKKQSRWLNAVLLFNEAYESASREKFESSLITLLTLLESLFISINTHNKKDILTSELIKYFDDTSRNEQIKETIKVLYEKRNSFVHEGKRLGTYQIYKSINDYEGLVTGMEPLKFAKYLPEGHDLKYLHSLFVLCKDILLNYELVKKEN